MSLTLQIFLIICLLIFLIVITRFLITKRLNLKYTLMWFFAVFAMLIITVFPDIVTFISKLVGIASPVNMIFLFAGMFSLLIILTLTMIVSHLNNKVHRLSQTQALLEKRIRDLENKAEIIKNRNKSSR